MKQEPGLAPSEDLLIKSLNKWANLIQVLLNHHYKYSQMAARAVAMGKKKTYPSQFQLNCLHLIRLLKSFANKSGNFIHCTKCRLRICYAPRVKLEASESAEAQVKHEAVEEPGSSSQEMLHQQLVTLTQTLDATVQQVQQLTQNQEVMSQFITSMSSAPLPPQDLSPAQQIPGISEEEFFFMSADDLMGVDQGAQHP